MSERVRKPKRCTGAVRNVGMWLQRTYRAAELQIHCGMCVCVWRLNSVLIKCPQTHTHTQTETGRNKRRRSRQSWSEISELGKRLQVGCTAARGALETNPLAWTVSKKKQCAAFRPSTREGEQCSRKKAPQLASNAQPVDTVSSLNLRNFLSFLKTFHPRTDGEILIF